MANTLANTSIYQSDLSGFKKPIVPAPKPQGNQNYSASSYLNNAPAFQQVALGMAKWNSPQAETQARYGGSPKSSKSTQSSSKSTAPTLPNKSTLPTPPSTKRSSSVYTPPVPAIPGANPLDELYKRTPPPIKAELEAPKVATTTTPVIDLTKKQDDVYTPANYDFIDTMDIKGLKNLYRSFEYDKQQGKTLTKDQQLQMLYAQDRIGDLTKPQTMENPIDPIEEQRKQEKLQRQAELEAEQKLLITAQDNNEKQYIESQNILLQQAEDEQKKVMGYILGGQGAGTSSYGAEQLNKIGMNFTAQKQALLSESQERIQKYRAELSGASATELAKYDTNIQQLQLLSAQYDIDNVKAINEYNMQEGKDLASKFTALYDTSVLQAKAKAPLTAEETALAGYYSNFLVKDDGSLDPTTLALLEKTNPLLINSAVEQGIAIQKDRISKGDAMNSLDMKYKQAQIDKLNTPEVNDETFTYTDNEDGTLTRKGNKGSVSIVDTSGSPIVTRTKSGVPISQAIATALEKCKNGAQCGKFVNDILEQTGYGRLINDSYDSKEQAIATIGQANTIDDIGAGSVFAYPVMKDGKYTSTGHIGIVTGKNADGTLNLMDYNYKGDQRQRERLNVSPQEIKNLGGSISIPMVTDDTVVNKDNGPLGGSGAPISYERRIKSMIPATLMNSEVELKQLNDTIKALHDSGATAEDAVLTYLGVSINKPEDKEFVSKLITIAKGLDSPTPAFYSNISDFINKGDRLGAVMKLEREAVAQAQKNNLDLKFSDAGTSFVVKQAKNIQDLMRQYEGQFGPITGTWANKTKGLFGNKQAQELATKITQAISKARNDLVGSNITQNERDAIKDLIPALEETVETAKIKVQNLIDTPLSQYNEARISVGLPELTVDTLINRNRRLDLYNGNIITDTTPTTTTTEVNSYLKGLGY